MKEINTPKKIGIVWLLLGPILFFMAAISTVESLTTYYIQLVAFGVVSLSGFISGIGLIFNRSWAVKLCFAASCLGCIYFVGASILMLIYMIPAIINHGIDSLLIIPIALGSGIFGLPFFFMAKQLKASNHGV